MDDTSLIICKIKVLDSMFLMLSLLLSYFVEYELKFLFSL